MAKRPLTEHEKSIRNGVYVLVKGAMADIVRAQRMRCNTTLPVIGYVNYSFSERDPGGVKRVSVNCLGISYSVRANDCMKLDVARMRSIITSDMILRPRKYVGTSLNYLLKLSTMYSLYCGVLR